MIRTAIAGADTPLAGELIRILVNHDECELVALASPSQAGLPVSKVHHGLLGILDMNFVGSLLSLEQSPDLIFIVSDTISSENAVEKFRKEGARIIDLSPEGYSTFPDGERCLGLSEMYRKRMVRGETACLMPRSVETAALISLYPLAANLLLNGSLSLSLKINQELLRELDITKSCEVIKASLSGVQNSFVNDIEIATDTSAHNRRCLRLEALLDCSLSLPDVYKLYDAIYDDHSFTFVGFEDYGFEEVQGTNRILISLQKPTDRKLKVEAVMDARLRGGAGEAVHAMNLLFGLYEMTGLKFKPSSFTRLED